MPTILSYGKPDDMSDEDWVKKRAGDGKNPTMRVVGEDGFDCQLVWWGYETGQHLPEYVKAKLVVHAKREMTTNKLLSKLHKKLLRKKVEEVVAKHKGGGK